jgi:hypothetical protein
MDTRQYIEGQNTRLATHEVPLPLTLNNPISLTVAPFKEENRNSLSNKSPEEASLHLLVGSGVYDHV